MNNLLLISYRKDSKTALRIAEECANLGLGFKHNGHQNLVVKIEADGNISVSNGSGDNILEDINYVLINENTNQKGFIDSLVWHITRCYPAIRILNQAAYIKNNGGYDKLSQILLLASQGIRVPNSLVTTSSEFLDLELRNSEHGFEKIVKPVKGSLGYGIEKLDYSGIIKNEDVRSRAPGEKMIQRMLNSDCDYRVIVLGGKVLGVMRRTKVGDSIVTNYSAGGSVEKADLDGEALALAVRAAEVLNMEYAGVDVMINEDDGLPYILEVNRFAQFRGFEPATGLNVARRIIEVLTTGK